MAWVRLVGYSISLARPRTARLSQDCNTGPKKIETLPIETEESMFYTLIAHALASALKHIHSTGCHDSRTSASQGVWYSCSLLTITISTRLLLQKHSM